MAKEINSILKITDGGGLFWSKISAEIPYLANISKQIKYFEPYT